MCQSQGKKYQLPEIPLVPFLVSQNRLQKPAVTGFRENPGKSTMFWVSAGTGEMIVKLVY